VKERPILFNGPMVRAILAGKKTQTRRKVKLRTGPVDDNGDTSDFVTSSIINDSILREVRRPSICGSRPVPCPYGVPGDRLWVRETWAPFYASGSSVVAWPDDTEDANAARYLATPEVVRACPSSPSRGQASVDVAVIGSQGHRWRPSIHMPRWASRITLEVTDVRVERLREISPVDARAEAPTLGKWQTARDAFASLWEKIHGEGSWGMDPWVWVVGFKRVTAP